jgi:hypothetical protein
MENNDLQKLWNAVDLTKDMRSKEELNLLLGFKARQSMNRILVITVISIFVSVGLLSFLLISSLNRLNDFYYLLNNLVLSLITLFSLFSGVYSWNKLRNTPRNISLKKWLEFRVKLLTRWFKGKYVHFYKFLIPFLYLLIILSIHVYYEEKLMIEVLRSEESLIGLAIGTIAGLSVAYYGVAKIRRYQLQNLEFLKNMLRRITDEG